MNVKFRPFRKASALQLIVLMDNLAIEHSMATNIELS